MDEPFEAVIAEAVAVLGGRARWRTCTAAGPPASIALTLTQTSRPTLVASRQYLDVLVPPGVDLLILDDAPLELAGRVALGGRLLFEDDQVARVRWEAMTRKIYSDERPRIARAHREFAAAVTARAR